MIINPFNKPYGLYIHIPFCHHLCHYCDFAKTANYSKELTDRYFKALEASYKNWLEHYIIPRGIKFKSVYFGGGTPSIFSTAYTSFFELISPYLEKDCQISLEANPLDVKDDSLKIWKSLGINRISLGVQSFQQEGLKFLTREHSPDDCKKSLDLVSKYFEDFNIDLIFGWKNQNLSAWKEDLKLAVEHNPSHMSCYLLTYAPQTPLGRAHIRGKLAALPDDGLCDMFEMACDFLGEKGFFHEEISNWIKPTYLNVHNHLYWLGGYYIALGNGAHGYIEDDKLKQGLKQELKQGIRYAYSSNERLFSSEVFASSKDPLSFSNIVKIDERSLEDLLTEYVDSSMRTYVGSDLLFIEKICEKIFDPTDFIKEAIINQKIVLKEKRLCLNKSEWFSHTSWVLKILDCFKDHKVGSSL